MMKNYLAIIAALVTVILFQECESVQVRSYSIEQFMNTTSIFGSSFSYDIKRYCSQVMKQASITDTLFLLKGANLHLLQNQWKTAFIPFRFSRKTIEYYIVAMMEGMKYITFILKMKMEGSLIWHRIVVQDQFFMNGVMTERVSITALIKETQNLWTYTRWI